MSSGRQFAAAGAVYFLGKLVRPEPAATKKITTSTQTTGNNKKK